MIHHRHSIRLPGYDYAQEGCYFVTIVSKDREPIFGNIVDGVMQLSEVGRIVEFTWHDLENHNPDIGLDEFVIMPNHIHGIIQIYPPVGAGSKPAPGSIPTTDWAGQPLAQTTRQGAQTAGPAPTKNTGIPLSEIVRQFKTFSAKRINQLRGTPGIAVWQRNYYDHIIGSDREYESIAAYIMENPLKWSTDEENPL
jgi:putative transposase